MQATHKYDKSLHVPLCPLHIHVYIHVHLYTFVRCVYDIHVYNIFEHEQDLKLSTIQSTIDLSNLKNALMAIYQVTLLKTKF